MGAHTEIEAISAEITALARKQAELHKRRVELGWRSDKMWQRENREAARRERDSVAAAAEEKRLLAIPFEQRMLKSLDDYGVSVRLGNVLRYIGVVTVGDFLKLSPEQIRSEPNAGAKTAEEFRCIKADLLLQAQRHQPADPSSELL